MKDKNGRGARPDRPSAQAPSKSPTQILARLEREKAKKLPAAPSPVSSPNSSQSPQAQAKTQAQARTSIRLALANGKRWPMVSRSKAKLQTHPLVQLALANAECGLPESTAKTAAAKPLAEATVDPEFSISSLASGIHRSDVEG